MFAATESCGPVIGVVMVYAIVQSFDAYLILPMIMRGAVKIHPAVTLFSVVLWGKLFGVPGMMLAIPINLSIAAAIEETRPRAVIAFGLWPAASAIRLERVAVNVAAF